MYLSSPPSVLLGIKRRALPRALVERLDRKNVVPVALALAIACGLGDFVTTVEIPFTLLYLAPITLAVWFRGRAFAGFIAALCISFALSTDIYQQLSPHRHLHIFHLLWNHGGSLILFLIMIELVMALHGYIEKEARGRRIAVEQLRHGERLNVIGLLASGVAHELGTPLSIVLGSAELIGMDMGASERSHRLSRSIVDQANRMANIIRKLLEFGRKGDRDMATIDLTSMVKESVGVLQAVARKRGTQLEVALPHEPIEVLANRQELEQVLGNLVVNALQATPPGGTVRVECDVRPKLREVGAENDLFVAAMTISDSGAGIPSEDLPHIFDPFFTTKDVGHGTGLGLSVSHGIVHDHGGAIEVDSHVGSGTRFAVLLPLVGFAAGRGGRS